MSITVHIPTVLRSACAGASELSLSARTVRLALEGIERSHPDLFRCVCDETGAVRRHVNIFINSTLLSDERGLDTTLVDGDVVTIFQAVSGG